MLTLFRWLSRWPLWLLHVMGGALGWLSYVLSPLYRRRFQDNARQAGVSGPPSRAAIAEAGRLLTELPYLWMRPASRSILRHVTWEGDGLIDDAHARGQGIVFLTPHMGCFEVTAQAYAERYAARHGPITVLYRPARKAWLRELVDTARERPGLAAAPATLAGVRQMMRALRRGEAVGLLPDQVPPHDMGVWAPFFGRPAYTMTLAARLAQQTGAALILAWGERLAHGRGYVVHLSRFDEALPTGGEGQAESAAAVNRAMERLIRQRPQQYLWGYDRYKTPRGTAPTDGAAAPHRRD
ncbi:lysophospholipid acyltransferase family protein [Piscinibacter sp. XHJ-5]|uniref:lysophospholipid acyltransferase family protein n=1 Tax=Piscinibacter sp. XHJ-5 TaxID=3037797 RepID=UPI002452DB4B|nr:lysophospholipid acyltransferase family protein [Piscinibacter sp. XHJ-5]